MNIKEAEKLSGISKRNIRFYEQEGLISPTRNTENDYREYSEQDINLLKIIRALRMVDMPLDQVREVIKGQTKLKDAAAMQKEKLQKQAHELETAIQFCKELGMYSSVDQLNIDGMLTRMDAPQVSRKLFSRWVDDYKKFTAAEHEKVFTFIPDDAVKTPREFTMALFKYADDNNLNLVITKEGMYPEFTIDGVEYRAERHYMQVRHVPVASIRCTVVHPEDFEPDIPESRKRILKVVYFGWAFAIFFLVNLPTWFSVSWADLLKTWEGWLVILVTVILAGVSIYRFYVFHYNEK